MRFRTKRARAWAAAGVAVMSLAGVVVGGMDRAHEAPRVRLHGGSAWLASSKAGQLTLLDGASAEVAARVDVAAPGTPIHASQLGPTGYALNKSDGTVVRVDGATLLPSRPSKPLAGDVLPTSQALYALDSGRGLLTPVDPVTLTPRGAPFSLAAKVSPDGTIVDSVGRLWILDRATGDLTWFTPEKGHTRAAASTADRARLTVTDGRPALLDLARRTAELLDPDDGSVQESARVDLRPDDAVEVTGSAQQQRILISVASRGLLMVCSFGADSCAAPIPLGTGKAELGAAIETDNHAVVPDYGNGQVWIIDLGAMRVVARRQLFDRPVRFELLTRDGVVFYNDPDSDQAGVLDLDGGVRAVSKYNPVKPGSGPVRGELDSPSTRRQPPSTGGPLRPGTVPPVEGAGDSAHQPPPPAIVLPQVDIVLKPSDRGVVGEEFELTAVARGPAGLASARWTFGDGTQATGLSVRHSWDRPGEFQIHLAATTDTGVSAPVAIETVTIEPVGTPPRIAALTINPATPKVGESVRFGAQVTGQRPDRWEWMITSDRGSVGRSTRREFQHTFTAPGTYTATLAVTASGVRVEKSQQLTVERAACQWKVEKIKTLAGFGPANFDVRGTDSNGNYSGNVTASATQSILVVLWTNGEPRIAREFADFQYAHVADENSAGTILVNAEDPRTGRQGVFLFTGGHTGNGTITQLLPRNGYEARSGTALNDRGDVLVWGTRSSDGRGFTMLWPAVGDPIVTDTTVGDGIDLDEDGTVLLYDDMGHPGYLWRAGQIIPLESNGLIGHMAGIRAGKAIRTQYQGPGTDVHSVLYESPDDPRPIEVRGTAEAINANGLIAGHRDSYEGPPAVWRNTAFLAELPLPDGATEITGNTFVVGDDEVIYASAANYGPVKWTCS
ncbi:PKD domain-containing protein [Kibdelosporangium aridum]|uniref:PKD domain-containing protein n=1 Tax=Kibdelosporangium aridum TaxID=2030 RepID=A0A1Y5XZS9_KIBAR|nr:PKD domain-containing protein [Kibdelosporangium aridum]SMD22752.1 PKD domain-containing protein [Kibdelosporangium aridum]